jgi:hypothetical protein
VERRGEERVCGAVLDDPPGVEHGAGVGHRAAGGEVVRDEEEGEAELRLQLVEQREDLGLDRDVERRDRLVADEEARAEHEGARDPDPLALPAGEFVGVFFEIVGAEADPPEERAGAVARGAAGLPGDEERLGHEVEGAEARVERGVGVLVHHLRRPAPRLEIRPRRRGRRAAEVAAGTSRRGGEGRLAGARLADEGRVRPGEGATPRPAASG